MFPQQESTLSSADIIKVPTFKKVQELLWC